MSFTFPDIILVLGAAQGLLLATLIFHRYREFFANRFLGALMLCYGIVFLDLFFEEIGVYQSVPRLQLTLGGVAFLIPPLHYFYAKFLIHRIARLERKMWLHFLPFLLYKFYILPDFWRSTAALRETLEQNEVHLPLHYVLFNWAITTQGLIYMALTIVLLRKYARGLKAVFSTVEKVQLDWLRNITLLVTCVLLSFLVENIFFLLDINLSNFFTFSSLFGAVSVYVMGYLGISKSGILAAPEVEASIRQLAPVQHDAANAQRYQKSGLSAQKADATLAELLELMQREKPYQNSSLTLPELAERLSISTHNLSEVINTRLEMNFFDFINQYRVEDVKKSLADPARQNLTLLAIAFEAGFNSKTAFNTIFKKQTGLTPSAYRQQNPPQTAIA